VSWNVIRGKNARRTDTGWTPQAIKSAGKTHPKTWKNRKGQKQQLKKFKILNDGLALRSKANPSQWNGFAKQSQSITIDWLCEAKPTSSI